MNKKLGKILIFLAVGLFLTSPVFAQDIMPGKIEGTGTYFEIKDSEYLNITLKSTEEIKLTIESIPELIIMMVERPSSTLTATAQAKITITGFNPLTTYHKFQDDYHNKSKFITDENGTHTYIQDISQPHLVFIQPIASTKFIKDDLRGGDCYLIGNWNNTTKTCTLNQNVNETIEIDSSNITIDGNGYVLTGNNSAIGVYMREAGTIRNINITNFSYASYIYFYASGNASIYDSVLSDNFTGLGGYTGRDMIVKRVIFQSNTYGVTNADKQIYSSTFENNKYGLAYTERIDVYDSKFTGNEIALYGGRGELKNNIILNNNIGVKAFFEGFAILNNTITDNDTGVILGQYNTYTPPVEYNNIYNNIAFNIKNAGPSNKSVKYNWWGTTNPCDIEAKIYDAYDDTFLGIIEYSPVLTEAWETLPSTVTLSRCVASAPGGIFKDTIWTLANSPYLITQNTTLFPNYTLTIEPGVEVKFSPNTQLRVRGTLIAEGTALNRIEITSTGSTEKGSWQGIYIATNLGGNASIKFADFSYAQTAIYTECCWGGGPINIYDSSFKSNLIALGGYAGWDMIIERALFENNTYAVTQADKKISNSIFRDNDYGLYATERIDVYDSKFTGNEIALYGGRGELKNNIILNNNIGVKAFFEGFALSKNIITNNEIGVILSQYDTFTPPVEYNNIYSNTLFNLKNSTFRDKEARYNWWGTTDRAEIDAKIYDGYDDPSLGIVYYEPILTTPVEIEEWEAPPPEGDEELLFNVAVILAEPNDVFHQSSSITAQPCKLIPKKTYPQGRNKEYFEDLLYCVADYHKENSFDKVNLDFTIYDNDGEWFRTDKSEEEYLGKENEFVVDAINLATNAGIYLSNKDIVIVVHSGTSLQREKQKLSTQTWTPDDQPLGRPPYKIIVAEDDLVGAWAHEIGHIIGALITPENTLIPDLYNMGNVEKWDLMARGSWNGGLLNIKGTNPPYMSSYVKEFLGWLNYDIHPKSAYGDYWINSLETSNLDDNVFRYNLSNDMQNESQKYYILEPRNRTLKTWDSSLPGLPVVGDKNLVLYYVDTKGLPEYGYVPEGIIGYQEGMMWNQYRYITIPGSDSLNDGVLNPLVNETYRDLDNLVKFSAMTDRIVNDKYEIQAKIEEITYDSFSDKFWGAVLRPKSTFKKWIEGVFNPSFANNSELYKFEENSVEAQLAVAYFNPETGKWEGGAPMKPSLLKELIYKIKGFSFYALIFLVMLSILSGLVRFIARWLSERKRKTIKNISRIIWITTLIIFLIFIIFSLITRYWESKKPVAENLENFKTIANPSQKESGILPDLDLHLYCDDDRHIGMNYETGEYEVQIPEAIVSGNNQGAPEWIFIPESIDNCNYFVSSYSNQKFLEENPEITQEIEDTTDSYEIYARYIDNKTAIYTSAVISEDIAPGIELKHPISVTDNDIKIGQGILIADVDCDPDTLNLNSRGQWITCYIGLPSGYDVWQIDGSTILLNGEVPAYLDKQGWAKAESNESNTIDDDGELKRMVKFKRDKIQDILEPGEVILTITGKVGLVDFEGEDTIRVITFEPEIEENNQEDNTEQTEQNEQENN